LLLNDHSIFVNRPTSERKQILKDQLAHQQEMGSKKNSKNHYLSNRNQLLFPPPTCYTLRS